MQTTALLFTALAALAAAAPAPAGSPSDIFEVYLTPYTNGDTTCQQADAGTIVSVTDRSQLGKCLALPAGTESVTYRVPAYAQGVKDCTVTFYDDAECEAARLGLGITNGALGCQAATSAGPFAAAKVTC